MNEPSFSKKPTSIGHLRLKAPMPLLTRSLDQLKIRDERAFRHIQLYGRLKKSLIDDGFRFAIAPPESSWQRVLFLNLSFWNAAEPSDVLQDESIDADVVTHAAWHNLARKAMSSSTDALFMGEAIASAFDLYLVGRILGHVKSSSFLKTQLPAMAAVAADAGMADEDFEALIQSVVADPERAFEELRQLLFDATTQLLVVKGVEEAAALCQQLDQHRFGCLLHHYELSTWVLYARANSDSTYDPAVRALDEQLRKAPVSLEILESAWLNMDSSAK